MQTHFQLQPNHSQLYDFCEECQCFHQAYYSNGNLLMAPCENSIHQLAYDQKIYTETNVTLPNTESMNSISTLSIKNHFIPTAKQAVIRPDKYKNLYVTQQHNNKPKHYPSKSPQRLISTHKQTISPQKMNIIHYQTKKPYSINPVTKNSSALHNYNKKYTLVQNGYSPQAPQKKSQVNRQPNHFPIVFANFCQTCLQTPQFGSQSIVSQNKQNSISSKRLIKQQKQFIIPIITEGRNQKSLSQTEQDNDYFCCGYIKKFHM